MEPVIIIRGKDLTDKEKIEELLTAAGNNDVKKLTELITLSNYKPLINHFNFNGWTALQYASRYGHYECAQVLLEAKALPDLAQEDGYTALMSASQWGHIEIVKLLLASGAETDCQEQDGQTAAMLAKTEEIREIIVASTCEDNYSLPLPDTATVVFGSKPGVSTPVTSLLSPSDFRSLPVTPRLSTLRSGKVCDWALDPVLDWLQCKNYHEYVENFRSRKITGSILLALDDAALAELGIPEFSRKKLFDEIQVLKSEER